LAPTTFARLFGWGCLAFGVSVVCIGFIHQRRESTRPSLDQPPLRHVTTLLRGGDLVRLGTAQILASSLQLALPFYVLFARDRLGLGGDWIGSFIVAQTVGMSVAALLWARVAERYGARLVVCLSAAVLIVIPLLPALAERTAGEVLLGAFVLAGAARGGFQAGFWQYTLDLVPARDRRVFMGLANTANAPSLLMPVVGGALLAWGGYSWLFAGSVLLGCAATLSGLRLAKPAQPFA
jgi:MFS family permease